MLVPQQVQSGSQRRQGSRRVSLAELRRSLAGSENFSAAHRQRLAELARRAAQVRTLGDEFSGIELSEHARDALREVVPAASA